MKNTISLSTKESEYLEKFMKSKVTFIKNHPGTDTIDSIGNIAEFINYECLCFNIPMLDDDDDTHIIQVLSEINEKTIIIFDDMHRVRSEVFNYIADFLRNDTNQNIIFVLTSISDSIYHKLDNPSISFITSDE